MAVGRLAAIGSYWLIGIGYEVEVVYYYIYSSEQACQQYISIATYLFIAINIFIIALFSILQYIIAAKKLCPIHSQY